MFKADAIKLLGGTISSAARKVGITASAVSQWPDQLPPAIADRVVAAIARERLPLVELGYASPREVSSDAA